VSLDAYGQSVPLDPPAVTQEPTPAHWQAFADALHGLLRLDRVTRDLVAARMLDPHEDLPSILRRLGLRISVQAAHSRLRLARKQWPALRSVLHMRLLSEGRRSPAEPKG
jgi:hypothetical protein